MVCAGNHGVGVLSLGAGLIGGKKDLAAQWAMGRKAAASAGRELRWEDWRLVIRAHLADSRDDAIAAVRDEREHYYRRVAGMKNDTTLEEEIEQDTSIIGTPDDMIAALHRLQDATGGFGGFMVLANDWAPHEATLRSYELIARRVMPEMRGHLASLRASYDMVAANKRSYGGPAVAAIRQAFTAAGEEIPDDLSPGKLR
jgi:limonene 1,2-monooxygenase